MVLYSSTLELVLEFGQGTGGKGVTITRETLSPLSSPERPDQKTRKNSRHGKADSRTSGKSHPRYSLRRSARERRWGFARGVRTIINDPQAAGVTCDVQNPNQ